MIEKKENDIEIPLDSNLSEILLFFLPLFSLAFLRELRASPRLRGEFLL
jgi:hypothetical protein